MMKISLVFGFALCSVCAMVTEEMIAAVDKGLSEGGCAAECAAKNGNFIPGATFVSELKMAFVQCVQQCTCRRRGGNENECIRAGCVAACDDFREFVDNSEGPTFETDYMVVSRPMPDDQYDICVDSCACAASDDYVLDFAFPQCLSDQCYDDNTYFDDGPLCLIQSYVPLRIRGYTGSWDMNIAGWLLYCANTEGACSQFDLSTRAGLISASCHFAVKNDLPQYFQVSVAQPDVFKKLCACELEAASGPHLTVDQRVSTGSSVCIGQICHDLHDGKEAQGCIRATCDQRCELALGSNVEKDGLLCRKTCQCQAEGGHIRDCLKQVSAEICTGEDSLYGYDVQSLHSNVCEDYMFRTQYEHQSGLGKRDYVIIDTCEHARYADKKEKCLLSACHTHCKDGEGQIPAEGYGECVAECKCTNFPNRSGCYL